jgi:hypothetical protein
MLEAEALGRRGFGWGFRGWFGWSLIVMRPPQKSRSGTTISTPERVDEYCGRDGEADQGSANTKFEALRVDAAKNSDDHTDRRGVQESCDGVKRKTHLGAH